MKERKYWYGKYIDKLEKNQIFVFGSNPKGSHGAGAAKTAIEKFGAIKNQGRGLMGQSYGLITKNLKWDIGFYEKETGITYDKGDYKSVSPEQISDNVLELYECARNNPDKEFLIVYQNEKWPNGQGKKSLNGYYPLEMLGFLMDNKDVPDNIVFHESYKEAVELKLKGFTNSGIRKQEGMKQIHKAYKEAEENGTLTSRTINPSNGTVQVHDAYDTILKSKSEKKITAFFTQFDVFSQWHPSKFEYKGFNFISAEQFMMFSKAKLFKDETVANYLMKMNELKVVKDFLNGTLTNYEILSNTSAEKYLDDDLLKTLIYPNKLKQIKNMSDLWSAIQAKIKAYGKEVCKNDGIPWDEKLWKEKREKIIFSGSKLKYSQNEDMKSKLLDTKGSIMVEASKYDKIYGVGMSKTDSRISDPSKWEGLNLLGKALTNLRYYFTIELNQKQTNKKKNKNRNRP